MLCFPQWSLCAPKQSATMPLLKKANGLLPTMPCRLSSPSIEAKSRGHRLEGTSVLGMLGSSLPSTSSSSSSSSSLPKRMGESGLAARIDGEQRMRDENCPPIAVIIPGWFSDSSQYQAMASHLRSKHGLQAVVVPIKWYNWIPSLGGRSVRPILDRIEALIYDLLYENMRTKQRNYSDDADSVISKEGVSQGASSSYTLWDFVKEFLNPKQGAHPPFSCTKAEGEKSDTKIILVAHSAAGWICRILLGSKVPYDGKIYSAAKNISGLVTLGTPHICTDKLTKRNMEFVNTIYPGTAEKELGVQYVCVAGRSCQGESRLQGFVKDFAWQSYELCCGKGDVWGDGVIPVECALGLKGAQHIVLEGVEHFPSTQEKKQAKWYGTPDVVDQWVPYLLTMASLTCERSNGL